MKLTAPKPITFWIAVIVALIGLIAFLIPIPVLSGFAFWIVVLGFIILAAANLIEGL